MTQVSDNKLCFIGSNFTVYHDMLCQKLDNIPYADYTNAELLCRAASECQAFYYDRMLNAFYFCSKSMKVKSSTHGDILFSKGSMHIYIHIHILQGI